MITMDEIKESATEALERANKALGLIRTYDKCNEMINELTAGNGALLYRHNEHTEHLEIALDEDTAAIINVNILKVLKETADGIQELLSKDVVVKPSIEIAQEKIEAKRAEVKKELKKSEPAPKKAKKEPRRKEYAVYDPEPTVIEHCPVCGKEVKFGFGFYNKGDYIYKKRIGNRMRYMCSYTCNNLIRSEE